MVLSFFREGFYGVRVLSCLGFGVFMVLGFKFFRVWSFMVLGF